MERDIRVSGFREQISDRGMESRFGLMALSMKDGGRIIKPMEEEG